MKDRMYKDITCMSPSRFICSDDVHNLLLLLLVHNDAGRAEEVGLVLGNAGGAIDLGFALLERLLVQLDSALGA
jgi:hypothetical protein